METITLINLKSINLDDPQNEPRLMTIAKDKYDTHVRVKSNWLEEWAILEGKEETGKTVNIESDNLIPKNDPFVMDESEAFDPFLPHPDVKLQGEEEALSIDTFVDSSEPKEPFNKPKKEKRQRKKAIK
jgi:hypothetical protein